MIEGLKVTIQGRELKNLCLRRAEHHRERAATYQEQLANLESAEIEGMNYTGGDPKKALRDKKDQHRADAQEIEFIGEHVNEQEVYLLERDDLRRIGVVRSHSW